MNTKYNTEYNTEYNPEYNTEHQDIPLNYNTIYNKMIHVECAICFEYMVNDIAILSCLHKFHNDCIVTWFSKKNKPICPICNNIVFISNTLKRKIVEKKMMNKTTRQLPIIPPLTHPLYHISSPINNRLNRNVAARTNWLCCTIL